MSRNDIDDLRLFTNNIWTADGKFNLLGAKAGTRMTVVKLSDGSLWIHSPIPCTDALAQQVNDIGRPAYIVAPSKMHNLNTGSWKKRYPDAKVFQAEGAKIKWDYEKIVINENALSPWRGDIKQHFLRGMPMVNEWVFFHVPSRTLIVADMLFNFQDPLDNWTRLLTRMYGVYGRVSASRLFRKMIRDRHAFEISLREILSDEIDNLVLSHGNNVLGNAGEMIKDAYADILSEALA
ncbi:MAG: DUF4336 domain-containing protein [Gammaproteobacteria bacterium]|nr:DUF4336 domain-containing protein [Gammaproteobacteria bacterium]